jgi:hypothetical protein
MGHPAASQLIKLKKSFKGASKNFKAEEGRWLTVSPILSVAEGTSKPGVLIGHGDANRPQR